MVSFPHCKINLGLRVISRRDDGYHDIETCFFPVPWNDVLEIIPSETMSFTNTGLNIPGRPEDNLCLKAYYLLKEDFDLSPVSMHLHKIVPMGAGLGGGSSDGAFALKLLNLIFELELTTEKLSGYAARLGSDCTFFIGETPMLGTGRGEQLDPIELSLKGKFLVIVKPDVHVSTAAAYRGIKPSQPNVSLPTILNIDINQWSEVLVNDFEEVVFAQHVELSELKARLIANGAVFAAMSGSGSALFGIFDSAVNIKKSFPNCLYWSGAL